MADDTLQEFEDWDAAQQRQRKGNGADNLRERLEANRIAEYQKVRKKLLSLFPNAHVELFFDKETNEHEVHLYHPEVSLEISAQLDNLSSPFVIIQIPNSL